jgi:hypothetical protein
VSGEWRTVAAGLVKYKIVFAHADYEVRSGQGRPTDDLSSDDNLVVFVATMRAKFKVKVLKYWVPAGSTDIAINVPVRFLNEEPEPEDLYDCSVDSGDATDSVVPAYPNIVVESLWAEAGDLPSEIVDSVSVGAVTEWAVEQAAGEGVTRCELQAQFVREMEPIFTTMRVFVGTTVAMRRCFRSET